MKYAAALGALLLAPLLAQSDSLDERFRNPPEATKPRCYWYWMDGHITKDGITRDLEAMKRVGIGEGYIGLISGQSGMKPNPQPKALSDEWWSMLEHAVREGGRLGVDIGLFNSPGWSQSGGPWVKHSQAMRYVVLPETRLRGPQRYEGKLPAPAGDFQDVAVVAFPAPAETLAAETARTPAAITWEAPAPFTARSLTILPTKPVRVTAELQADGRLVKRFAVDRHNLGVNVGPVPLAPVVVTFPAVTSKSFRVTFSSNCEVGEARLSSAARVESYAEKSLLKMFQDPLPPFDFYTWPAPAEPDATATAPASVLDLSKSLAADGTLRWDVPAGEWIVLRAGLMPTGTKNAPAPEEATGLEVDKMNRAALKSHFDAYVGELLKRVPAAERKAWKHVVADSYETGSQNWTDGLAGDFRQRYGYDPTQWLPVLAGHVVGSADQSDRFLWDLRRLVADRVARDYVGGLRDLCREQGLKMWLENYGHWGFPSEFLLYGGSCDEISGEFWANGSLGSIELRDAASAAHIYGMPVVWAEAFTGGPAFVNTPRDIKARGDWALCEGINQFVLHVYIHQPWEDKRPGVNAWFGTEFNRHNTWFDSSRSWVDYLRRCSVLLQAGLHVADAAYFISEDAPKMAGTRQPELPAGYDFDYINADVLLNRAHVQNGRLVLSGGMSYAVLVLPPSETMRPELMKRIAEFTGKGLPVVGEAPKRSPSLENFPACDAELRKWTERAALRPKLELPSPDVVAPAGILWKHRRDGDTDIYFVSNQQKQERTETLAFRVDDRAPEFWWPDSGRIERPAVYDCGGGSVRVPVRFAPHGSVFVVFRAKADPGRVVAVKRNGQRLRSVDAAHAAAAAAAEDGTFTMSVWVNPAADTPLLPEANRGIRGMDNQRNDVLFPAHGDTFVPDGRHAGCGLAAGRNGVCVFEHGANYFAPVLVHAAAITNWTHVAVVYRGGQPRLYLNGVFVHEGLKSEHVVHPTDGESTAQFRGAAGGIETSMRALADAEVAALSKATPPPDTAPGPAIDLTLGAGGRLQAHASKAGTYEVTLADGKTRTIQVPMLPPPAEITGAWEVQFAARRVMFEKLVSWTEREEPDIRPFSGTATYRKEFSHDASSAGERIWLDLGRVEALATVSVNGQVFPTLWKAPYCVDITAALKPGPNTLEVSVVNCWNNRLVADAALPAESRQTWYPTPTVQAHSPLQPAGLLGPVQLLSRRDMDF